MRISDGCVSKSTLKFDVDLGGVWFITLKFFVNHKYKKNYEHKRVIIKIKF